MAFSRSVCSSSGVWQANAPFDVGALVRYRHMMVDYGLLGRVVEPSPLWPLQPAGADGVVLV